MTLLLYQGSAQGMGKADASSINGMASTENHNMSQQETTYKENRYREDTYKESMHEENMQEGAMYEETMSPIIRDILKSANRTLFSGYPVDETFFGWIAASYGEENLLNIRDMVAKTDNMQKVWMETCHKSMHVLWAEYCREYRFASYELSNVHWGASSLGARKGEANPNGTTVIDLVGDINLSDDWHTMEKLREVGFDQCISPAIQAELQRADITFVNNEFTYSQRGDALRGKSYVFRSNPENVSYLARFGCDIVSLANNHVYDYGRDALLDTLATLRETGIPYVGAGENLDEAMGVQYFIHNGRKIAFVSASQIERYTQYTKEATADDAGVLKCLNPELTKQVIATAKAKSDYVIAYIHWGTEGYYKREASQVELANAFVDAGADIIVGDHPHRLQGVEYIKGVPVLYSLGNFWFSTGTLYTTIAQIRIDENGEISVGMIPCIQKDLQTSIITESEEKAKFYQFVADVSNGIGIREDGTFVELSEAEETTYASGKNYATYVGSKDLEGRKIDIVGNLE